LRIIVTFVFDFLGNGVYLRKIKFVVMARPIKETPTLYGADARRFEKEIANPKKISAKERKEMDAAYEWFKSRATFPVL